MSAKARVPYRASENSRRESLKYTDRDDVFMCEVALALNCVILLPLSAGLPGGLQLDQPFKFSKKHFHIPLLHPGVDDSDGFTRK